MILGSDGFLYGTTSDGGASGHITGDGTVFKVAPDGTGFQIIKHLDAALWLLMGAFQWQG